MSPAEALAARQEGWDAYKAGKKLDACPYAFASITGRPGDATKGSKWAEGWHDARRGNGRPVAAGGAP